MKRSELRTILDSISSRRRVVRLVSLDGEFSRTFGPNEAGTEEMLERLHRARKVNAGVVELDDGRLAYVESIEPQLRLILVGGVHIAQAILSLSNGFGYETFVIDPRSAFVTSARFPGTVVDTRWPAEAMAKIGVDRRTAVCALTHDPKIDDPALRFALASEAFYIGALGSRRTHEKRIRRLLDLGVEEAALARIRAPIGLDIGAVGEREIALSIMAEITRTLRLGAVGQ